MTDIDFTAVEDFSHACVGFRTARDNKRSSEVAYAAAKAFLESLLKGHTKAMSDEFHVSVSVNSANGGRTIKIIGGDSK